MAENIDMAIHQYKQMIHYPNVISFYTDREDGYSCGNYGTFNCNSYCGDNAESVYKNRQRLIEWLGGGELIFPKQTHSTNSLVIDENFLKKETEEQQTLLDGIDALITNIPDKVLCISTADCIPITIYDPRKQVIATIHAGWRGTVGRIVKECVETMQNTYGCQPQNLIANIGPGISVEAFEVGTEVYETFKNLSFDMERISQFNSSTGKWHIDLKECNKMQLIECGIKEVAIEDCQICTYNNHHKFFSARRLTIHSGRITNGIVLKG